MTPSYKTSKAVRALKVQLREVNRQIAALTPNGAVCKQCLSVDVHWLHDTKPPVLVDNVSDLPHRCPE